jgi:hypothetical protein
MGKKNRLHENLEALHNEDSMAQEEYAEVASDVGLRQAEDSSMNDLVRALTDQFLNIDSENSRDLSAVGMALSEIPAEMPGLTDNSTSFREEILSSLLFTGDEEGFVLRAEKLRGCLESVATHEHSGAIEELKLLVAELVTEALFAEGDDETPADTLGELHHESTQLSAEGLLQKAAKMQEMTTTAREYFASDKVLTSILATGAGRPGNPVLEAALRSLAEASVTAIANSLQEQEEQVKIYKDTCEKLVNAKARMDESKDCLDFVEQASKSDGLIRGIEGTQYQWLGELVDQFRNDQESYDRICDEKTAAVTDQISILQSESDQLGAAVRKLGAETLEPPQSVLQSLTGADVESTASEGGEMDYEESITQYLEWVTTQRESIRELKRQLARVDQQMLDAEIEVDKAFSGKLASALQKKEETVKRLNDAHRGAKKDYEEAEVLVAGLLSDADEILEGIKRLTDSRSNFIGDVEDSITTTMIKLGEVLYEGNARANFDGEA